MMYKSLFLPFHLQIEGLESQQMASQETRDPVKSSPQLTAVNQ